MEHFVEEQQTVSKLSYVTCDVCGQKCVNFEYMLLDASWGYESKYDCQHWKAHICEKCVDSKLRFVKFIKTQAKSGIDNHNLFSQFMQNILNKLLGLLLEMNLKPKSGWGETKITWEDGRIIRTSLTTTENYR